MFSKVLIANRGEIACRVIRTCKRMGINTVAIYSEADHDAPHVKQADEAYLIGGPRVADSYLNVDTIMRIAKESKVEAIHPGYGLLSENELFAKRCEQEGLSFIGPTPDIILAMGDKIEARGLMKKAGVPVVPGILHELKNADEAIKAAEKIGYPIMLKASAGGGGIGMQLVTSNEEMRKAFEGNQKRAQSFFGNGAMYIEKFIENPRHIEIQILADSYGNIVHLWERECSIQRRNQKVIEEAPSLFLNDETRLQIGETAVKAAKSLGYRNAGTVEFLVDANQQFYFLEMNTRIQVEHPVTEEITGIDIVEEQIKIAAGMCLSFSQKEVKREGHALEVRIYAEDPVTFYPSPGKLTSLVIPDGDGIRHELAVHHSSTVTPYYDPLIAKLIVKGKNREEAISKMKEALDRYKITGIKTNIPMLQNVLLHEKFRKGETTTSFVQNYLKE